MQKINYNESTLPISKFEERNIQISERSFKTNVIKNNDIHKNYNKNLFFLIIIIVLFSYLIYIHINLNGKQKKIEEKFKIKEKSLEENFKTLVVNKYGQLSLIFEERISKLEKKIEEDRKKFNNSKKIINANIKLIQKCLFFHLRDEVLKKSNQNFNDEKIGEIF